jgi:hypothetical protein
MAAAAIAAVELLGVDAVEAMHAVRELLAERLDDEVVVVRHQTESVDEPVVPARDGAEEAEKEAAVVVVEVDGRLRDAARDDVVNAVGEDVAREPSHCAGR